jgi:hypothetical protein
MAQWSDLLLPAAPSNESAATWYSESRKLPSCPTQVESTWWALFSTIALLLLCLCWRTHAERARGAADGLARQAQLEARRVAEEELARQAQQARQQARQADLPRRKLARQAQQAERVRLAAEEQLARQAERARRAAEEELARQAQQAERARLAAAKELARQINCVVCMAARRAMIVFLPCRHLTHCAGCAVGMMGQPCPTCLTIVTQLVNVSQPEPAAN